MDCAMTSAKTLLPIRQGILAQRLILLSRFVLDFLTFYHGCPSMISTRKSRGVFLKIAGVVRPPFLSIRVRLCTLPNTPNLVRTSAIDDVIDPVTIPETGILVLRFPRQGDRRFGLLALSTAVCEYENRVGYRQFGISQQKKCNSLFTKELQIVQSFDFSHLSDSNRRPRDYKSRALTS
jgi:hypothetical protein